MKEELLRPVLNIFGRNLNLYKEKGVRISKNCYIRGNISLLRNVRIGPNCTIKGNISIASSISENTRIIGNVFIQKYCAFAPNISFQGLYHDTSKPALQMKFYRQITGEELKPMNKGPIEVGNDVWIGFHSIILSGITIGNGAVIGANSTVTKTVEPYEIVAGCPAKHIAWRFPAPIRKHLLNFKWWDYDIRTLTECRDFFTQNLLLLGDSGFFESWRKKFEDSTRLD